MNPDTIALRPPRAPRFNREIWNQLSSFDIRLLDELAFLSRCTAKKSPTNAHYCVPSRRWLAARLQTSISTVSRHTSKLKALGILDKSQRRPVAGVWQTCLYALVHPTAWAASRVRALVQRVSRRVSKPAHLASSLQKKCDLKEKDATFAALITRWKARGVGG